MTKRKTIYTILAVVLVCCIAVAGTLAYLTAQTSEVKNTFTSTDTLGKIDLKEHEATVNDKGVYTLGAAEVTSNSYKVLPGVNLPKDPFITITDKSDVASYLYVEVVDELGENSGLSYALTSDWTKLNVKGANGGDVYVYQNGLLITDTNAPATVSILKDNVVTVGQDVNVDKNGVDITFYGYMAQASAGADAAAAYTACFNNTSVGE
jgi:predicted ribosomally synthesized peptide with SipW-like signal peptide